MPEMSRRERTFCQSAPWRAFTSRVVLPWALQGFEPRGEVLEIGCGSGAMAARLLAEFPDLRMTATDFDPAMVEVAAARLAPFGDRATVERADATALAYGDDHFDGVVSFIMLHHVIDWEPALSEVTRVLRPGGCFVGYDIAASAPARFLHAVQRETHRMVSRGELQRGLRGLAFDDVRLRRAAGGLLMRFRARKAQAV